MKRMTQSPSITSPHGHRSSIPMPMPMPTGRLVRRSSPWSTAMLALLGVTALPACAASEAGLRADAPVWAPQSEADGITETSAFGGGGDFAGAPAAGSPPDDGQALLNPRSGGAAAAEPVAPEGSPEPGEQAAPAVQAPAARLIIYRGQLHLIVNDVEQARRRFLTEVESVGGHLQSSSLNTVVVRIPSAHFDDVTAQTRRLGRVASEQIDAQDVTREVFELSMRIDNAERARVRLLELLERGGELEHVLRLEQELRRVTEEIELLKGKRRQLEGEAAFSTLTLRLSPHAPPPVPMAQRKMSPFPWVRTLGPERVLAMPLVADDLPDLLPSRFDVPSRFVAVEAGPWEVRAVSAEGARVWLRTHFVQDADLDFWQAALLDELKAIRGYDVLKVKRRARPGGSEALEVLAETTVGGVPTRYQLIVEVDQVPLLGTTVTTLEHVGELDGFDIAAADLLRALELTQPANTDKASPSALAVEAEAG